MAILAAVDLNQMGVQIEGVYTFAQPRVGNMAFATYLDNRIPKIYRVINSADFVPHTPSKSRGYVHGGLQIWYHPNGMQKFSICMPESEKCSDSHPLLNLSFFDHLMTNYLQINPAADIVQNE